MTRKIRVDWFKHSGKWYAGGLVEVSHLIWEREFLQDILDNQQELAEGWEWHQEFTVVCGDQEKYDNDATYSDFSHVLIKPESWEGMKKSYKPRTMGGA